MKPPLRAEQAEKSGNRKGPVDMCLDRPFHFLANSDCIS